MVYAQRRSKGIAPENPPGVAINPNVLIIRLVAERIATWVNKRPAGALVGRTNDPNGVVVYSWLEQQRT
jgi:hypothetical protein